jgi:hypothetical protein
MKSQMQGRRTSETIRLIDILLLNDDGTGWELKNARDLLDKYRDRVEPERKPPLSTYRET